MTSNANSAEPGTALVFPLKLETKSLDAGTIVIETDLDKSTLDLLAGIEGVSINLTSDGDYAAAAGELAKIKAAQKKIDDERKKLTKPLDDEKSAVMAYVKPFTDALARVEGQLKNAIVVYGEEVERKRRLAEADAAEKARKESEALNRRADKAEGSGKVEKADALREQASSSVFVTSAPAVAAAPAVSGLSKSTTYNAECTDLLTLAKACVARSLLVECGGDGAVLIQHLNDLASHGAPLRLIQADTKVLGQLAKSLKEDMSYPGVKLVTGTSVASRAAKA